MKNLTLFTRCSKLDVNTCVNLLNDNNIKYNVQSNVKLMIAHCIIDGTIDEIELLIIESGN